MSSSRLGYGGLVGTAFAVLASFHVLMALLGSVLALTAPGFFNWNGAPAENAAAALGVIAFLLVAVLLIDALACAVGAAVWMLARRWLPGQAQA